MSRQSQLIMQYDQRSSEQSNYGSNTTTHQKGGQNPYAKYGDFAATSIVSIINPILIAEEQKSECISNYSHLNYGQTGSSHGKHYQQQQQQQKANSSCNVVVNQSNMSHSPYHMVNMTGTGDQVSRANSKLEQRSRSRMSNGSSSQAGNPQQHVSRNIRANFDEFGRSRSGGCKPDCVRHSRQNSKTMTFPEHNLIKQLIQFVIPKFADESCNLRRMRQSNDDKIIEDSLQEAEPDSQFINQKRCRSNHPKSPCHYLVQSPTEVRVEPRRLDSPSGLSEQNMVIRTEDHIQRRRIPKSQSSHVQSSIRKMLPISQPLEHFASGGIQIEEENDSIDVSQENPSQEGEMPHLQNQVNHLSLMFLPSDANNNNNSRTQAFHRRKNNIETKAGQTRKTMAPWYIQDQENDCGGPQYFSTKDYFNIQAETPPNEETPHYSKNREVLKHLKKEICSIDQEILELQSNLGINMKSQQNSFQF